MLITLTTDFGYIDPFVGIMKGVIAGINPDVQVVDVTHGVPPQNLIAGALVLRHSVDYFPAGTIHVVVVDPGVGSTRRPVLIQCRDMYLIGPDNGVLSLALESHNPIRIVELSNRKFQLQPRSNTFHGRDIFAPAAAHLSRGVDAGNFGAAVDNFVRLELAPAIRNGDSLEGQIVYIDGFGNLFTTISGQDLTNHDMERITVRIGDTTIDGISRAYVAGETRRFVAVINSWGLVEVAVPNGNAAQLLGAGIGDKVQVQRISENHP